MTTYLCSHAGWQLRFRASTPLEAATKAASYIAKQFGMAVGAIPLDRIHVAADK